MGGAILPLGVGVQLYFEYITFGDISGGLVSRQVYRILGQVILVRGGNVVDLGGHLVDPLIDAVFGVFSLRGHEGLGQVIVHGVVSIGSPGVGVPVAGEGGAIRVVGIAGNVGYRGFRGFRGRFGTGIGWLGSNVGVFCRLCARADESKYHHQCKHQRQCLFHAFLLFFTLQSELILLHKDTLTAIFSYRIEIVTRQCRMFKNNPIIILMPKCPVLAFFFSAPYIEYIILFCLIFCRFGAAFFPFLTVLLP